jgi:hypothetical protein
MVAVGMGSDTKRHYLALGLRTATFGARTEPAMSQFQQQRSGIVGRKHLGN